MWSKVVFEDTSKKLHHNCPRLSETSDGIGRQLERVLSKHLNTYPEFSASTPKKNRHNQLTAFLNTKDWISEGPTSTSVREMRLLDRKTLAVVYSPSRKTLALSSSFK